MRCIHWFHQENSFLTKAMTNNGNSTVSFDIESMAEFGRRWCLRTMLSLAVVSAASLTAAPDAVQLRQQASALISPIPETMPGSEHDTKPMVKLGKKLFFEKRLSINNSQSCNSCHAVDQRRGGVDNQPTSPGAQGKRGGRNSPTVLNAGFHFAQFWDGRAETLADQAKGPILNPIEMGMPDSKLVMERLTADKGYQRDFKAAFPGEAAPINYDNLAKAIAAFERTLVTRDRFDDFLKGDDKALSAAELRGLQLFLNKSCTTCHDGPVLGGNRYQKIGLINEYPTADKGRAEVTKEEEDLHRFKVPSLRNIALTAPYFHDGSQATLQDVVRQMGWLQLGVKFTESEVSDLVAFLGALSDKPRAKQAKR